MRKIYSLFKFWVLIKVAKVKLKRIPVGFIGNKQENLKSFLLDLFDKISQFLVTSHSAKVCRICRKMSEDLIDICVGLHKTYPFPVWDNVVFYALDLKNLAYRMEKV